MLKGDGGRGRKPKNMLILGHICREGRLGASPACVLKGAGGRGRKPKSMRIIIIIRMTIKGSFSERAGGRERKPKLTLAFKFSVFDGGRRQGA